jgi:hypothetical protein
MITTVTVKKNHNLFFILLITLLLIYAVYQNSFACSGDVYSDNVTCLNNYTKKYAGDITTTLNNSSVYLGINATGNVTTPHYVNGYLAYIDVGIDDDSVKEGYTRNALAQIHEGSHSEDFLNQPMQSAWDNQYKVLSEFKAVERQRSVILNNGWSYDVGPSVNGVSYTNTQSTQAGLCSRLNAIINYYSTKFPMTTEQTANTKWLYNC